MTFPQKSLPACRCLSLETKEEGALGGAHVLNETQLFFLALVHFSQLRLSRVALNRKGRRDSTKKCQ